MDRPDDRNEAVLRGVLSVVDTASAWQSMPYEDVLRQLQAMSAQALGIPADPLARKPPDIPDTPEATQAIREAVGRLDPHAEDQYLDDDTMVRRLLEIVEKELSKWTSGLVQPPGLSGSVAVAEVAPVRMEEPAPEGTPR